MADFVRASQISQAEAKKFFIENLIWHDFMFGCSTYPDHLDWFVRESDREMDYQTKRLRASCVQTARRFLIGTHRHMEGNCPTMMMWAMSITGMPA